MTAPHGTRVTRRGAHAALLVPLLAVAAATAHAAPRAPRWKSTEMVSSSLACAPGGGDCAANVRAAWRAKTKLPLAVGVPQPDPDAVVAVSFGELTWSGALSGDPSYAPGARRATVRLARIAGYGADEVVAKLRWSASGLTIALAADRAVGLADFVDDPSARAATLRDGVRACVSVGAERADFAVVVAGSRSGREVGGGGEEDPVVLPRGTLRGKGAADARLGAPLVLSDATPAGAAAKAASSPFFDVAGQALDGGTVTRVTTQVGEAAETDVAPLAFVAFPCGGSRAEFAASVQVPGPGTHAITVRAYDDQGEVGLARHTVKYAAPDLGPRVVRIFPLEVRVPRKELINTGAVGLLDEAGRLWLQDSGAGKEDGDTIALVFPTASPTPETGVRDVQAYRFADERSAARHDPWIVVRDDGSVTLGGDEVAGLPAIASVAAEIGFEGFDFTLALGEDGTVHARGANAKGQLGDGSGPAYRHAFAPVPGLADVARIETAGDTCFALTEAGVLHVWGAGADLLRGDAALDERVPGPLADASPVVDFSAYVAFDNTVRDLYTVHADGSVRVRAPGNTVSFAGNGQRVATATGATYPSTAIAGLADVRRIVRARAVNAGPNALALRASDGALLGWGSNQIAELGLGHVQEVLAPVGIDTGGARIDDIALVLGTAAAITDDARLLVWGGLGFQNPRPPTEAPGLTGVDEMVVYWGRVYARTSEGRVFSFDTYEDSYRPRAIALRE